MSTRNWSWIGDSAGTGVLEREFLLQAMFLFMSKEVLVLVGRWSWDLFL